MSQKILLINTLLIKIKFFFFLCTKHYSKYFLHINSHYLVLMVTLKADAIILILQVRGPENQRGDQACLKSQSKQVVELVSGLSALVLESKVLTTTPYCL